MTRSNYRIERVNEVIKEVLSEIVMNEVKDPRVGLVTIVSVRVTHDLSSAKVMFSVMGDEEQRAVTIKMTQVTLVHWSTSFRHKGTRTC